MTDEHHGSVDDDAVAIVSDPDTGEKIGKATNEQTAKQMEQAGWEVEYV